MRQVCNIAYADLMEGRTQKDIERLDKELVVDPVLIAQHGRPSQGVNDLMAVMRQYGGPRGR